MNFTPLIQQVAGTAIFTIVKNMIVEKNVKDAKSKQISKTAIDLAGAFFMPNQMRKYINTDFLLIRGALGIAKSALKLFESTGKYISYLENETEVVNIQDEFENIDMNGEEEFDMENETYSENGMTMTGEQQTSLL